MADLLTSKQNASIPAREKICHDTYSHPSRSYWTPFEVFRKLFRGNDISVSTLNDRSVTSSGSYCLLPKLLPFNTESGIVVALITTARERKTKQN